MLDIKLFREEPDKIIESEKKRFRDTVNVEKVIEYCKKKHYNINTIDGVRVTFTDGWASVRYSNTGPNITSRFEATTKERLEEIKCEFESLIDKYNK